MASATAAVQVAYVTALRGDAALTTMVRAMRTPQHVAGATWSITQGYVFDTFAPPESAPEYITIPSGTENDSAYSSWDDHGSSGEDNLHIWSGVSQLQVRLYYAEVRRILETPLVLTGQTFLQGRSTLAGTFYDRVSNAYRGLVIYHWEVVS